MNQNQLMTIIAIILLIIFGPMIESFLDAILNPIFTIVGFIMMALFLFLIVGGALTRDIPEEEDPRKAKRREAWKQANKPAFKGGFLYVYQIEYQYYTETSRDYIKVGVTQYEPLNRLEDWISKHSAFKAKPHTLKRWAIPAHVYAGDLELHLHKILESSGFPANTGESTEVFHMRGSYSQVCDLLDQSILSYVDQVSSLSLSPALP